jgi:hypothetical protein
VRWLYLLMPRSISLLMLSHWRLGWLLAALLWMVELRPSATVAPVVPVGTVLRTGSCHPNATPAVALLEQITLNREAIALPGADTGSSLSIGAALLPPQFTWALTRLAGWPAAMGLRCASLPARFQQQLLLVALAPNAP